MNCGRGKHCLTNRNKWSTGSALSEKHHPYKSSGVVHVMEQSNAFEQLVLRMKSLRGRNGVWKEERTTNPTSFSNPCYSCSALLSGAPGPCSWRVNTKSKVEFCSHPCLPAGSCPSPPQNPACFSLLARISLAPEHNLHWPRWPFSPLLEEFPVMPSLSHPLLLQPMGDGARGKGKRWRAKFCNA